jgi:DNA-binding NarL/FixJ family response regulator
MLRGHGGERAVGPDKGGSGVRARVVLVEDDRESRVLLRRVLEDDHVVVVGEASDGAEGVDLVRELQPDVVLMDLEMPGTGGIEATRAIKQEPGFTQVIVLTAYDGPFPTRSAHEVGAYAYLVKGCSAELMRDVILQAYTRKVALNREAASSRASR